jgi:hypothetical protein
MRQQGIKDLYFGSISAEQKKKMQNFPVLKIDQKLHGRTQAAKNFQSSNEV